MKMMTVASAAVSPDVENLLEILSSTGDIYLKENI